MNLFKNLAVCFFVLIILNNCDNSGNKPLVDNRKLLNKKVVEERNVKKEKSKNVFKIEKSILNPTIEFDKAKVLANEEQELFALIKFKVSEDTLKEKAERPQINLSMVIDRSGSMGDRNKLDFVKEAALFVVDEIKDNDKLGIVEYDDQINTLWPLRLNTSKNMVKKLINSLQPRGGTNLCGGLTEGIEEIERSYDQERVNRVILLSDGLANQGITSPAKIAEIVTEAANNGLTVSTIGVGLDYNEDLLQNIAECGKGNYYYIEDPVQIKEIFQEELSSIFKTVAKNVNVKFAPSQIVNKVNTYGYKESDINNLKTISLANMYSGEEKMVLLKITVKPDKKGIQSLGVFSLSYYDCFVDKEVSFKMELNIVATKDSIEVEKSVKKEVAAEAELIRADNEHEKYVKQFEEGRKAEAEKNISELLNSLSQKNQKLTNVKLKKKIDALQLETNEMKKAEESLQNRKAYLKSSKQKFYLAKKGKRGKYLMQQGDTSYDVKRLQKKLIELNLYNGKIDGVFNKELSDAVKKYQEQNSLESDGVAGPNTLKKLELY